MADGSPNRCGNGVQQRQPETESTLRVSQSAPPAVSAPVALTVFFLCLAVGYVIVKVEAASANTPLREEKARLREEKARLREEKARLYERLERIQDEVARLSTTLERIEQFDEQLRGAVAFTAPPEGILAMGPVGLRAAGDDQGEASFLDPRAEFEDAVDTIDVYLADLTDRAGREEASRRTLGEYIENCRSVLDSAPRTWPARGWVSSTFGPRIDPYTGERVMHRGVDIAASKGTPVIAPADANVSFADVEGPFGKLVILDHGYSINTCFGHLAQLLVRRGEKVTRGQRIGLVGSTGRSTGPHLHYEVRVDGLPVNPQEFIFE